MNISLKTIIYGLFEEQDGDIIIITTITIVLTKMRQEWVSSHSEHHQRLYKSSTNHWTNLWQCMENGTLPDEEDNPQAYLNIKNALVWVADNIGSFWV